MLARRGAAPLCKSPSVASHIVGHIGASISHIRRCARTTAALATYPAAATSTAGAVAHSEPTPEVLRTLQEAEAFAFDVDSTFCEDESIDEIAAFLGVGEQVAALTARAMGGTVEFKEALRDRLGVMQPSQQALADFLALNPHKVTKGIPDLVRLLVQRGKRVFLVSGGFRQVIHPLAQSLDIPLEHVFANTILFDAQGNYAGFDENEFTCRSGGKPAALKHIKETFGIKSIVMVGDGATDAEARQAGEASLFIGYGGVVVRPAVAAKADWYILDIHKLIDALRQ